MLWKLYGNENQRFNSHSRFIFDLVCGRENKRGFLLFIQLNLVDVGVYG